MNNAMRLKAVIKNIAKDKHISAQLVMQNFILKGGFLISAKLIYRTMWLLNLRKSVRFERVMNIQDTVFHCRQIIHLWLIGIGEIFKVD